MYLLKIEPFRIWIRLGCMPSEQAQLQPVDIEVELNFHEMPKGCVTDNLDDTVCYADFCKVSKELCERKNFALIEHLAHDLHKEFEKIVKGRAEISVVVHKLNPPVDGFANGVIFIYAPDA